MCCQPISYVYSRHSSEMITYPHLCISGFAAFKYKFCSIETGDYLKVNSFNNYIWVSRYCYPVDLRFLIWSTYGDVSLVWSERLLGWPSSKVIWFLFEFCIICIFCLWLVSQAWRYSPVSVFHLLDMVSICTNTGVFYKLELLLHI